jgi:hypothetical protein
VRDVRGERGQALLLLIGALAAVLVGAFVLGAVGRGVGVQGRDQRAADLAALAGAQAMRASYPRLFEPVRLGGRLNSRHLSRDSYLHLGRLAALRTGRLNGAREIAVEFPDALQLAPVRIRTTVSDPAIVPSAGGQKLSAPVRARAEAELAPDAGTLRTPVGR